MTAVYGLFPDPESAQRAVERLRAADVPNGKITVISSEPFEEWEFSHHDISTWMPWIAAVGGVVGLMTAYWLTAMTSRSWPLPTGGMPIVAPWPNLVIMFELTMLFGILATVATLLVTTGLPRRRPKLYRSGRGWGQDSGRRGGLERIGRSGEERPYLAKRHTSQDDRVVR